MSPRRAVVTGKWARYYFVLHSDLIGVGDERDFTLVVTYHRRVRGRLRQLTISDKLMTGILRNQ